MSCRDLQACYMRVSASINQILADLTPNADVSPNLIKALENVLLLLPQTSVEESESDWDSLLELRSKFPPEVAFQIWHRGKAMAEAEKKRAARMEAAINASQRG